MSPLIGRSIQIAFNPDWFVWRMEVPGRFYRNFAKVSVVFQWDFDASPVSSVKFMWTLPLASTLYTLNPRLFLGNRLRLSCPLAHWKSIQLHYFAISLRIKCKATFVCIVVVFWQFFWQYCKIGRPSECSLIKDIGTVRVAAAHMLLDCRFRFFRAFKMTKIKNVICH